MGNSRGLSRLLISAVLLLPFFGCSAPGKETVYTVPLEPDPNWLLWNTTIALNGLPVKCMVDSGSAVLFLTEDIIELANMTPDANHFIGVMTAGDYIGQVSAWITPLPEFPCLLGFGAFTGVDSFEIADNELVMR